MDTSYRLIAPPVTRILKRTTYGGFSRFFLQQKVETLPYEWILIDDFTTLEDAQKAQKDYINKQIASEEIIF